ncbi:hypothetical protein C8R45DRAFT_130647 [Mycena sanguinolenta]|nr:hypothetical protein C8R45DRAFT_130647 [Mycena sanguinolenta]
MASDAFVSQPMGNRRSSYYFESVVFEVETILFKIPRFQFERHSGIFATTFSLPNQPERAEGLSDGTPFKLEGIKGVDFERLLKVLYPLTAIPKAPDLSKDEWISVLKLANLWDFIEVRKLAIEQLASYSESLDCIERILFARQYDVSGWLRSGYIELARRRTAISASEAARIGLDVALRICQLREATVLANFASTNPYQAIDLGDEFQAEFRRADSAHEPLPVPPPLAVALNPFPCSPSVFNTRGNSAAGGFNSTACLPPGGLKTNGPTNPAPVLFGAATPLTRRSGPGGFANATSNSEAAGFSRFAGTRPSAFGFGPPASTSAATVSNFAASPRSSGFGSVFGTTSTASTGPNNAPSAASGSLPNSSGRPFGTNAFGPPASATGSGSPGDVPIPSAFGVHASFSANSVASSGFSRNLLTPANGFGALPGSSGSNPSTDVGAAQTSQHNKLS